MSFIQDLITLDVVTVTGDVRVTTEKDGNGKTIIDFDSLFGKEDGKTTVRGDLRIIAASRIEVDKDSLTFIGDNLSEREMELVDMHMKSVTMALEARSAIVARLLPGRE